MVYHTYGTYRTYTVRLVSSMPYDLGVYKVTYKGNSAEVTLERSHVLRADEGNDRMQSKVAMAARDALGARWVEYDKLAIEYVRDSSSPYGCSCNCTYCDIGGHCRHHGNQCYQ